MDTFTNFRQRLKSIAARGARNKEGATFRSVPGPQPILSRSQRRQFYSELRRRARMAKKASQANTAGADVFRDQLHQMKQSAEKRPL